MIGLAAGNVILLTNENPNFVHNLEFGILVFVTKPKPVSFSYVLWLAHKAY